MEHFLVLPDPRIDRTKAHHLIDIIVITVLAVICGADGWVDVETFGDEREEWLKQFLSLSNGIPSHDTFGRVFSLLDSDAFQRCFFSWVKTVQIKTNGTVVAIDGKAVRRSHGQNQKPLHIISAFACASGITLGQLKVDGKSNEITAIPELLDTLLLKGCIVTIDAMGTQGWIVQKIRQHQADYLLAVKANQKRLQQDIAATFDRPKKTTTIDHCRSSESMHGREDVRECWVTNDLSAVRDRSKWIDLTSVVRLSHTRTVARKTTQETRYYITSLPPDAATLLQAVRDHWKIENQLHWSLDVSFREDESRVRIGHAGENLALVRKLALHVLQADTTTKKGIKAKRLKAALSQSYLERVLGI